MGELNQEGRKDNAAQPLGERKGIEPKAASKRTAKRERRSAGPDGPHAADVTAKQDGLLGDQGDPAEGGRRR